MINGRPNLFDFATKELSQDAMICWLLSCFKSEDKKYKEIGLQFFRFLLNDNSLQEEDIDIEANSPHNQYYRMDVYSVVRIKNKIHPIIFEDKTDTYLHDEQLVKYCQKVGEWKREKKYTKELLESFKNQNLLWGETLYFYFKTGFISEYEKNDFEQQKSEALGNINNLKIKSVSLENMICFLKSQNKDDLINDYIVCLEKKLKENDYGMKNVFSDDNNMVQKALETKAGQLTLMESIFGPIKIKHHNAQNWSSIDLCKDDDNIYYMLSLAWRKNGYALMFRQWSDEKTRIELKVSKFNEMVDYCKSFSDMNNNVNVDFTEKLDVNTKSFKEKSVFEVLFSEKNNVNDVIEYVKVFIKQLLKDDNFINCYEAHHVSE